jgi:hypothetical protein
MSAQKHIEETLQKFREIFEKISNRIEKMEPGQKILATELAGEIASEYGMTTAQIYPIFLHLIRGYPGIEQKRGAKGGIFKLDGKSYPIATEHVAILQDEPKDNLEEEQNILPIVNT